VKDEWGRLTLLRGAIIMISSINPRKINKINVMLGVRIGTEVTGWCGELC
jgi:hypothetical protein